VGRISDIFGATRTLGRANAASTAPTPASGVPLLPRRTAIVELAIFVLIVLVVEWQWPNFDLNAVQPNPCWLPVLLLSLQYGTVSGLLAAAIAIVLTMLGGFPEQDIDEPHFAYLLRIWAQPLLWIAAAVVLGQFRYRQIAAKVDLMQRIDDLENQRSAIAANATNLRTRCDRLERQIVGRSEPNVIRVLSRLTMLQNAEPDAARAAFADILQTALPGCTATLWRRESPAGTTWHRIAHSGNLSALPSEKFVEDTPLLRAFDGGLTALSVMTSEGERLLAGSGLAAAAILDEVTGSPIGFLRIERVEPGLLGDELAGAVETLAQAMQPAVQIRDIAPHADTNPRAGLRLASGLRRGWRQIRSFGMRDEPDGPTAPAPQKTTLAS
jgi:hypothetical protein